MDLGSLGSVVTETIGDIAGWSEAYGLLTILTTIRWVLVANTIDRYLPDGMATTGDCPETLL